MYLQVVMEMAAAAAAGPALAAVVMVAMVLPLLPGRADYAPTAVAVAVAVAAALQAQALMAIPAIIMAAAVPAVPLMVAVPAALRSQIDECGSGNGRPRSSPPRICGIFCPVT